MNKNQLDAFYPMALAVRRLFHKLAYGVAALHQDSDVTIGMRAVLESVVDGGPQTVPHMAKVRPVTRQHIQGLVNALLEAGLVEYIDNPAHKRSKLVSPTPAGIETFTAMRAKENEAFLNAEIDVTTEEIETATKVLRSLIATFEGAQWRAAVARGAVKDEP
jgi:DNA-binding MarR family transcriptional regulator